jgi:predicted component of type VI protein secretion system
MLIDPRLFEDSSVIGRVSRAHFEVLRDHGFLSLVDKSANGTFVNELKVGKDQRCRLGHGDTIALLQHDFAVYSFLNEAHIKLHFPEQLGSRYQAVHAVAFLHSRRVCHRDLKMENILLDTAGPTARIRVIVPHEAKLAKMTSANFTVLSRASAT